MFPTFISILDIQSWWEVPSIAYFCSLFRTSFNLLDFDIEDLEEALLTDGTEDPSWLQELIVRLLTGCLNNNNEISTFNYQMYLRRLFRQKCQETGERNPFNTDIDFQFLPLRTKVQILHNLCDYRLDAEDVLERLKNLEADSLRVEPLGHDENDSQYWYFYGTRLYREDHPIGSNTAGKKSKTVWQVICFTEDDWHNLAKKFKNSTAKSERRLYKVLKENFLPDLPRLFHEKEVLHRKRLLEWLPMRRGASLRRAATATSPPPTAPQTTTPTKKPNKKHRSDEDKESDDDDNNSDSKKQNSPAPKKRKSRELRALTDGRDSANDAIKKPIGCGRQTNNSLASATGDSILIKPSTPPPQQTTKETKKVTNSKAKEEPAKRGRKKKDATSTPAATKPTPPPITSDVSNLNADLDDMRIGMYKVLEAVKAHEDAWPFIEPVEEEYAPNYYTVVRRPMDLQTMEDRLDAGAYTTCERFKHDFKLIVDNCRLYNGAENEYTEMVDNLSNAFAVAVKKYLDQPSASSSEEEEEDVIKNGQKRITSPTPKVNKSKKNKRATPISRKRSPSPVRSPTPPTPPPVTKPVEKRGRGRPAKNKTQTPQPKEVPVKKKEKKRSPSPPIKEKSPTPEPEVRKSPEIKNNKRKSDVEEKKSKKIKEDPVDLKKDKNFKLRETIEKLKETNNLSEDSLKKKKVPDPPIKKETKLKPLIKTNSKAKKCEFDFEDDSNDDEDVKKKPSNKSTNKNMDIDALEAATEQTLKDINKWLDDTPKFSEFSSASNSPLHLDEPDIIGAVPKVRPKEFRHQRGGKRQHRQLKEGGNSPNLIPKRPQQRTIDRLQPGKSKGNLLNPPQTGVPEEELFPLGRIREAKGIAVKTPDETAPKLSLGTVLDSFGKHQFEIGDEVKKSPKASSPVPETTETELKNEKVEKEEEKEKETPKTEEKEEIKEEKEVEKVVKKSATPNLSAWFKAFGAPKVNTQVNTNNKKKVEAEEEKEKSEKEEEKVKTSPNEEGRARRGGSLEPGSPICGQVRQRRGSTGSSVSERSSFSQDLDMSPRDERMAGSYPAPYPSPLHRSPAASASPSPRHDPHTYPQALNGTIRVGFYQDTVTKSSPSPRNEDIQTSYGVTYYQSSSKTQIPNSPPPPTPQIRPPTPEENESITYPVKKRNYDNDVYNSPNRSDDEERHDYSITKDIRIPSLPRRYDDSPPPPTPMPITEKRNDDNEKEDNNQPLDYGIKPLYTYDSKSEYEPKIEPPKITNLYDSKLDKTISFDSQRTVQKVPVQVPEVKMGYEDLRIPSREDNPSPNLNTKVVNMGYEPKIPYDQSRVKAMEEKREALPYEPLRNRVEEKGLNMGYEAPRVQNDKILYDQQRMNPIQEKSLPINMGYERPKVDTEKLSNPYETLRNEKLCMGYMSGVNSIDLTTPSPYGTNVTKANATSSVGLDVTQTHRSASQYLASQYADTRLNHPVASYLAAIQNHPSNFKTNVQNSNFKPVTTESAQFKQSTYQSNTPPLTHNFDRFSAELHGLAAASYYADKTHMFNKMHMYNQQMAAAYRTQQQLIQPDLQYHQQNQQNLNQNRGGSPQVGNVTTAAIEQKVIRESKKKRAVVNVPQQQQQPLQGFQSYAELKASGGNQSTQEISQSTSTPQLKGSAFNLPWSEQPGPLLDAAVAAAAWAQRSGATGPTPTGSSSYTSLTAPPSPYLTQPTAAPPIDQPLYQQYLQSVSLLTGAAGTTSHATPPGPYPHPHHPHHPQYHPALAPQLGRQQPFHNMNRPWM